MSQILIVDDQSGMTTILKEIFQESNYEVMTAPCVADALKILGENAVDLLVTDILMPGDENGLDLIANVQSEYPDLKVIAISGSKFHEGDPEERLENAKERGATYCLTKPFKVNDLVTLAKKALGDEV